MFKEVVSLEIIRLSYVFLLFLISGGKWSKWPEWPN